MTTIWALDDAPGGTKRLKQQNRSSPLDKQKTKAMLGSLLCDLLPLITAKLEGIDIGRLWLCGNSIFNHRLSSKGVIHFRLKLDPLYHIAWPSLVRHFHRLESFEMRHRYDWRALHDVEPCIGDLSPSLKTLHLESPYNTACFFEYLASHPDAFPSLESLSGAGPLPEACLALIDRLPRLTRVSNVICLDELTPAELPLHLVEIKLMIRSSSLLPEQIVFPDCLESITLSGRMSSLFRPFSCLFTGLPAGLQSLVVYDESRNRDVDSAPETELLPRSLKVLQLPTFTTPISLDLLRRLPPNLVKLHLRMDYRSHSSDFWTNNDCEALQLLPKTLTSEDLCPKLLPPTIANYHFYPPKISTFSKSTLEIFACSHSKVDSVCLTDGFDAESKKLRYPDSVTSVEVKSLGMSYVTGGPGMPPDDSLASIYERFPLELLSLSLLNFKESYSLSPENLPRSLTSLHIRSNVICLGPADCEALPRGLNYLHLYSILLASASESFSLLPPKLHTLMVNVTELEIGCLKALPSLNLRKIHLRFQRKDETGLLTADVLRTLPRKLHSFVLESHATPTHFVADQYLDNLPPGLLRMKLYLSFKHFTSTRGIHFPKNLVEIELDDVSPWCRRTCIPFWSPHRLIIASLSDSPYRIQEVPLEEDLDILWR